jgi:hypothetical protein
MHRHLVLLISLDSCQKLIDRNKCLWIGVSVQTMMKRDFIPNISINLAINDKPPLIDFTFIVTILNYDNGKDRINACTYIGTFKLIRD